MRPKKDAGNITPGRNGSSAAQLRDRGRCGEDDIDRLRGLSGQELIDLLDSAEPAVRSAAVISLRSVMPRDDAGFANLLLRKLSEEKALYTRLAICDTLAAGGTETARIMCAWLGKIGNNQHRMPGRVSAKKNYPLARDIVARTLGRMNPVVFGVLTGQFSTAGPQALTELIDAFGYMVFYNPVLATPENFQYITDIYFENQRDELLVWKVATCCSAFGLPESWGLLREMAGATLNRIIKEETGRSLRILEGRYRKK